MCLYLDLFVSFFKVGAFTLGGGYVMIPLIEKEVVDRRGWIASDEFAEMLALAQSSPGPISVNTAVFVGYKTGGAAGIFVTVLGTVLPSLVAILAIALFFTGELRDNSIVQRVFRGIRPGVVALIAVPVFNLLKKEGFGWQTLLSAAIAAVAVWRFGVSPVIIIAIAGVWGIVRQHFIRS